MSGRPGYAGGGRGAPEKIGDWQARMRSALFEALDEAAMGDIVAAVVEKAKKGDLQAARLLLTYAVGAPGVSVRNAVIVQGGPQARTDAGLEPPPARPTRAFPGTAEKLEAMARRAGNGQSLCDARDAGADLD